MLTDESYDAIHCSPDFSHLATAGQGLLAASELSRVR